MSSDELSLMSQVLEKTRSIDKFCKYILDWSPHPAQVAWLRVPQEKRTQVLVAGRRWGKTESTAVRLLHSAIFRPDTKYLIISVTLDQARLMYDVILDFVLSNPILFSMLAQKPVESPFPAMKFKHGSEITVRTSSRGGTYVRGHGFHAVVIDEADYIPPDVINEVVRMTLLDTGGALIMITTPRDMNGVVYSEYQRYLKGAQDVYYQRGPSYENPHLDQEYLEKLRKEMPPKIWQREIEAEYAPIDGAVFPWDAIQRAYTRANWSLPEDPKPDHKYVAGWDLGQNDPTVGCVLDITETPARVVYLKSMQGVDWGVIMDTIRAVHHIYHCNATFIDATGLGGPVGKQLSDIAIGVTITEKVKHELIFNLQMLLGGGQIAFPFHPTLVRQLQMYSYDDRHLETDMVFALALACWIKREETAIGFRVSSVVHHGKDWWRRLRGQISMGE